MKKKNNNDDFLVENEEITNLDTDSFNDTLESNDLDLGIDINGNPNDSSNINTDVITNDFEINNEVNNSLDSNSNIEISDDQILNIEDNNLDSSSSLDNNLNSDLGKLDESDIISVPRKESEPLVKPIGSTYNEEVLKNAKEEVKQAKAKAKASNKRIKFKYQAINQQQAKVTGYIDGYSKQDIVNFLENEGYQVLSVKAQNSILSMSIGGNKLKIADLAFIITQLSTYLKAGIPLIDSVRILEKQSVKPDQKRIFSNITYELVKGESFSDALRHQGSTFPALFINMVKTSEMTGDLPAILDDMAEYYTTIDRTRKQVVSAMTYPIIIFIFAIMVITFILVYIIPEFVSLFEANNAEIPPLTEFVLATSDFLTHNALYLILGILIFLVVYTICFKKIKPFRKFMQTIFMKLPIVGNVIIYKEVAMFTKTFASLLNHNVFITDSMAILSTVSTNEVFIEIIDDSLDYLAKGAKISDSFKGKWAFPIVAYEMLVTGENTGRLPMMMDYVAKYYEDLYSNYIKRLNTFIEPVMIVFLAIIVGTVVLAVVIPMFSFYSQIA